MASHFSGEGHVPSAFSILEILAAIYLDLPNRNSESLKEFDFILSKGHASLALYAILEEINVIPTSWIKQFCREGSDFGGHPDRLKVPGVLASTGSLGHGLPLSVGRALGNRVKNVQKRIFCLIGDGELNEGSNWESFILMEQFNLNEITVILDLNLSTDRAISVTNVRKKIEAFNFEVHEVDGHNIDEIAQVLETHSQFPRFIIANTVKGKGIPAIENNHAWHHKSPSLEQINEFLGHSN